MKELRKQISEALLVGLLDEYMEKWQEVDQSWSDLRSPETEPDQAAALDVSAARQPMEGDRSHEKRMDV